MVQCVANYLADDDQLFCHLCDAKSKVLNDDGDDDFSLGNSQLAAAGAISFEVQGERVAHLHPGLCLYQIIANFARGGRGATTHARARSIIASWVRYILEIGHTAPMFACKPLIA